MTTLKDILSRGYKIDNSIELTYGSVVKKRAVKEGAGRW
jgi:hypothetical protein